MYVTVPISPITATPRFSTSIRITATFSTCGIRFRAALCQRCLRSAARRWRPISGCVLLYCASIKLRSRSSSISRMITGKIIGIPPRLAYAPNIRNPSEKVSSRGNFAGMGLGKMHTI